MNFVGLHSENGLNIVGPFFNEAAAEAWGQQQKDDRWFVLPELYVAQNGMLDSNPYDYPFIPITLNSPDEFAKMHPDGKW